jgi:hypothetical protein
MAVGENIPPLTRPARPRSELAVGPYATLWKGPDGQRWWRASWSARWLAVVVMLGDDRSAGRLNGRRSGEQQRRVTSWAPAVPSRAAREAAWRAGEGRGPAWLGARRTAQRRKKENEGRKEEERKEGKKNGNFCGVPRFRASA